MSKQPIRTYQRKTAKKPFVSLLALSAISSEKYNSVENDHFDKSGTYNNSLNHDPFETTFDRIAKGAVVPPMPLDINKNDSWKGSSSDSDINDVTNIKSLKHTSNLFMYNSIPSPTYVSHKVAHKRRKQKGCEPEISTRILPKRIRVMSIKNKMQPGKAQELKRQVNKIQKKKMLKDEFKSSRVCNGQVSHLNSNTMDNLKEASYKNGISHDNNYKHLHQNALKINKRITLQNKSIRTSDSITDFKQIANYQQIIKPCFVKLNTCAVQNYTLNREEIAENKQDILHSVKCLYTDTLQTDKDVSKTQNIISRSVSTEYNDFGNFKHKSVKQCSVAICDNIVKDWYVLKSKRNMKNTINISDKSNILHLVFHNSSEIIPNCNKSIEFAPYDTKKIKNSFVKVERLKIEEFIKKNGTVSNKKKQNLASSTPIGKQVKPSTNLINFSPINSNIYDKLHWSHECSLVTTKENISNIDRKDSRSLMSECYKLDPAEIQEQQTQVLLSQKSQMSTDSALKNEITSYKDNTHTVTQKYETKCNVEIPYSLNVSAASTNQSRSLFDDTAYNHLAKGTNKDNIKERCFSDALACKFAKISKADSSVDLCLEQKQLLSDNEQADASSRYIPSKVCITFRDLDNDMHMRQRINAVETVHENLKDETVDISKHSVLGKSQDNMVDACPFTRLQDPIRIGRRIQYPKWHLSMSNISNRIGRRIQYPKWHLSMSNISNSLNNEATQSNNEIFCCVATDKDFSNVQLAYNSERSAERSKNVINSSFDHSESFNCATQYNSTNKQIEKSVFLKPGKYWARSLSILNNINNGSDLDKLSIGKGKKWRHSVRNILDMQKRGIFQSCLKKGKNDTDLSSDRLNASNVSPFDSNSCKEFNVTNYTRFSKRISVRVVLNNTSIKRDIKDTPFLEAFGITTEKSPNLKLSYQEESLIHDDRIISSSTIARDVVLQKCSQNCYMSFADRFPDSYLEHCCKIGEGVYGEVFLYEYDGKKSVIKIIPIENEQLVNGEQQKKFSEILSEIMIAKELDDLKLNATYKTNGFVEVKNISCIKGKYPEKLIELWNIYDNNKTSDNDCPSMFGENQLYIALELGHGGEDLEAFVFQTAEEAYALFLQIALALAIAEKALEFEHRDLHWGNVLVSRTKEPYIYYNLGGREVKFPSKGVKVSIIDFTLSRMLYQGCCIYNDLALDPALFTAHGEYQFEIYRLMRDKIQNNWRKFEPYTNVLWLHYILDKMITVVRYKRKNLKVHKHTVIKLKDFKDTILNYDSAYDFKSIIANYKRKMECTEEDWSVECSDDEKYEVDEKHKWNIKAEDIVSLIEGLEVNNCVLELEWKCPGRRGPSPVPSNNLQQELESPEYKTEEKSDFDFMDEMSSPRLPVRRIGESTPKGSAKKKIASFNGVISTMLRHRRLEQQEINSSPKKIESPRLKPHPT
ncbi:putative serine/threonine-protein kinase haspin-like protein [Temnothorax longispinosus]|uniref:non-specific serine/threonine protein kinase n=2 Tax=Temnothorax TaxID=300110 RepID=A0A4S2JWW2_9HYME|nr:putative serine/threonine-protein kinase haspin-like protein [Temnothorax longispinosus]